MIRAAIYARFSSNNQKDTSLDDQITVCRRYAEAEGWMIPPDAIFTDRATSGSRTQRKGLETLREAAKNREFDVILVDDLSRLARNNLLMLQVLAEFDYVGVRLISVADRVDTFDEQSELPIQLRGVFNQIFLKDLKAKTRRGLLGQIERGYSVGERVFGYRSVPKGGSFDLNGRLNPDGYVHQIDPEQAELVRRVFQLYADGCSATKIVKILNEEGVPGPFRVAGRWAAPTVSRLLDNEKYIGIWNWNTTRHTREPITGKGRPVPRPRSEWIIREREHLRIIPQDLWDVVQARREKVRKAFAGDGTGPRGFGRGQVGAREFPSSLLSGTLLCDACGASFVLSSTKNGGYFGCGRGVRAACPVKTLVRRSVVEKALLGIVQTLIDDPDTILNILKEVGRQLATLVKEQSGSLDDQRRALETEERRLVNFVEFVADGRGTEAIAKAIVVSEKRVFELREIVSMLTTRRENLLKPPPKAWVEERLKNVRAILEQDTQESALSVRRIFGGEIRLKLIVPDIGRKYFRAVSKIGIIDLLDEGSKGPGGDDPSSTPGATGARRIGTGSDRGHQNGPGSPSEAIQGHSDSGLSPYLKWTRRESNPSPEVFGSDPYVCVRRT